MIMQYLVRYAILPEFLSYTVFLKLRKFYHIVCFYVF